MMHICRAEDGHIFQVNSSIRDIERHFRIGSLEVFVEQETGIGRDLVLVYLSSGQRLTTDNLHDLAAAQDEQSIYVFNKHYLDVDIEDALHELVVDPPLQLPVDDITSSTPPVRATQLAGTHLRAATAHLDQVQRLASSLHYQHEAIHIASTSIDLHVLALFDVFDNVAESARRELDKQAMLLAGLQADLELISRVHIHVEFVSPNMRKAIAAGDRPRTLGDYVSHVKMRQVSDTCTRLHEDLHAQFNELASAVSYLREGTDGVRARINQTDTLDASEAYVARAQGLCDQTAVIVSNIESERPIAKELSHLDASIRECVQSVTQAKNTYTRLCLEVLRDISCLNGDLARIAPALTAFSTSIRAKNSFTHIQRLHSMLYTYGATVIEIVRRKEFSRFFYQRAQSILEVMAKLTSSEQRRRQVYRSEMHGQLPFDTRMDDPVPLIDFSPTGGQESTYSLERKDIDDVFQILDDLDQYAHSVNDDVSIKTVQECRTALEKLIVKMDGLESGFDRIAERSLLSASRISLVRRRSAEVEDQAQQALTDQLRAAQDLSEQQEAAFRTERAAMQAEIDRFRSAVYVDSDKEHERLDKLEQELADVRAQLANEREIRWNLESHNRALVSDAETRSHDMTRILADLASQTLAAETVRQELVKAKQTLETVNREDKSKADRLAVTVDEQAISLNEARTRSRELEEQLATLQSTHDETVRALEASRREMDSHLRAQASEHDRIIRDHIAEADGDRAVLERQFAEIQTNQQETAKQLQDVKLELEIANSDAAGLRAELQRVEHELRDARHNERILRDDLRAGRASQSAFEQRLEDSGRLVAQLLDVALAFRAAHLKALHTAQVMTAHPHTRLSNGAPEPSASPTFPLSSPGLRQSVILHPEDPPPIDPSDPVVALEALRAFDHDHFLEAIAKTGSTIRKWQKQCKEYRERAKGKISFRDFAKGDLALFLPTRNSVLKPWAAFNVSFPHYFLQATGRLAEQLKTREWIVARITTITEGIVDHNDSSSNPYGLGDGVKYYMLQVEDWTQPHHTKRKVSSKKPSVAKEVKHIPSTVDAPVLPVGPPEPAVEDSFQAANSSSSLPFPTRRRSTSPPPASRPSSLSRLLAQAPAETEESVQEGSPFANDNLPLLFKNSSPHTGPPVSPTVPLTSPLRPASRSSKLSTASRFSAGRMPPFVSGASPASVGTNGSKGVATTAITEVPMVSSPLQIDDPLQSVTPSPDDSMSGGVSNVLRSHRRRTSSYNVPRSSPLATTEFSHGSNNLATAVAPIRSKATITASSTLASLANTWGFSRRKKAAPDETGGATTQQPDTTETT
ncbi:hypothetical protein FISHEDRAFT_45285 [Fistulina hepatica ATCC 64428]|uniref:Autophagy-related protein 11 n=1 Tax=Fistulina hepatica ATCC 64428 TaxID=1128425 RepID=A0A0D7AAR1_9AGAR|nr:hypothetical protein FISHEDRAFT_45285 [Fistulina hepatica ATCC 64428]